MQLLEYLLEGIVSDERTARGLLLAGRVLVNDKVQTSPHFELPADAAVRVKGRIDQPVSRGADKLRPVLEASGIEVSSKVCIDLGASTGGFSQVMLEAGAARVYAVDVGYGLIAEPLRRDPRIVLLERTNARLLSAEQVPDPIEVAVGDLSFISWRAVLPATAALLAPGAELLLLVKPQFELAALGRGAELQGGLVAGAELAQEALLGLYNVWVQHSLQPRAVYPAAIRGASGNQEYFVQLKLVTAADATADPTGVTGESAYLSAVEAAIRGALHAPESGPEAQQ